jgi:NAD(P)-dependent dehydrogenase (short-subunit alcohol dehydrogenase family)
MSVSRTALVTGACGVIGKAVALKVAREPGYEVIMVGRDPGRLETAVDAVRRETGNPRVRGLAADLSRPGDIQALADGVKGTLHVLVNNASATPRRREVTPEGTEMQFAVNVLAYVRLMNLFAGRLAEGAAESGRWSRIVNVASFWAGDLEPDDLEFRRRRYDNGTAYRQSKQAERMLTVVFAEKLLSRRIAVNACHPGEVNTPLSNSLGFSGHESPETGADTPVWLAVDPGLEGVSGRWFEYRRETPCRFMADREGCRRLLKIVDDRL